MEDQILNFLTIGIFYYLLSVSREGIQMAKFSSKNRFFGLATVICTLGIAYTVALTPVFAQQIVKDYQTATNLYINGNTTNVITSTFKNGNAFNSFSKFNVEAGKTVNLVVPGSATNLINLVHNEASIIEGTLNSLKGGQIGGNVFLVNPHGVTVGSAGVINVGSLTAITPTQEFMDNFFAGYHNPSDAAVNAVLTNTAPINPGAQILNSGVINAITDVTLSADSIVNTGAIYTGAEFTASDFVNTNTVENDQNLVVEDGAVYLIASNEVVNNGTIYTKDASITANDVDINNTISASNSASISRSSAGNVVVYHKDKTNAKNLYITTNELNNVETANLTLGDSANTTNVKVLAPLSKNSNVTLNAGKDVEVRNNVNVNDLSVNAGEDLYVRCGNKVAANGDINVDAGKKIQMLFFSSMEAKGDVVLNSGNKTALGVASSVKAGGDVAVNAGSDVVLSPFSYVQAGDDVSLNAGDDIVASCLSAIAAKDNVILTAADDIKLSFGVYVRAQEGSVSMKAGDDIMINAFVNIDAGEDIIVDADDKTKISRWADLDAEGDVIVK
jgi:filamentous hemagglutinin family protein